MMSKLRLNPPQILALGFLSLIILGSLLLSTPWAVAQRETDWLTAFFTSTSAVCVTGLVVVDTGTHWSLFGQVVILMLIQVGGLGVMSFATFFALLLRKRILLKQRLIMQQALNKSSVEGIVSIFRYLLLFSFIAEIIGALILAARWYPSMGWLKALWFGFFHSVSAFNNAGFDIFGNFSSLTGYTTDIVTNMVISTLFVVSGLGFVVIYEIYLFRESKKLSLHSRLVLITTLVLVCLGTTIIFISEYNNALRGLSPVGKLVTAYFQAVAPRTAGFNTIDISATLLSSQLLLMFLMFIGGSPGSTAGGIKTTTFTLLGLAVYSNLRGKRDTEVFRRRISPQEVSRALAITILALTLVFLVTFTLTFTEKGDFVQILFEVVSAISTVGLTLGLTTELSDPGRILIMITMFLGRLGPLTIGYALAYRQKQPDIRYPEGRIMVG